MQIVESNGKLLYRNKNVEIRDIDTIPPQTVENLNKAGDTINNYAKQHKAKVVFSDARKDMGEFDFPSIDRVLTDSVAIKVQRKGEDFSRVDYVNRYSNEVENKPFIRTVYEKIQKLVEGKDVQLTAHKKETMEKLIKAGKVLA